MKNFGYDEKMTNHYFKVDIKDNGVKIYETYGDNEFIFKADIDIEKWLIVKDFIMCEFNYRLKKMKIKLGKWDKEITVIDRSFGKELVLLAWGIENAEREDLRTYINNWLGLAPEERWYLYTMTNAQSLSEKGKGKGWRVAVQYVMCGIGESVNDNLIKKYNPLFLEF